MPVHEHAERSGTKANFDDIYVQPDPRAFYRRLRDLDYEVPRHGEQVFRRVLDVLPAAQPTIVDLCCSYGVNSALLNHELRLTDLYSRYTSPELADLSTAELLEADRAFYVSRRRPEALRVVGIDASAPAVRYARQAGLLDSGVAEDLERNEPSETLADLVADVDLFTVTGGIGYITQRTIGRLLEATPSDRQPWFAALVLRTVPYQDIAKVLENHDLVTEQLPDRTFPQRRFIDDSERDYALDELARHGIDPSGKESAGRYHVNVYLSRPVDHAAGIPIDEVFAGLD